MYLLWLSGYGRRGSGRGRDGTVCNKSEPFVSGKVIGLFGSYGWGDGQWMRDWEARMAAAGAKIQGGTGVICQEAPDEEALERCRKLGRELSNI